MSTTTSELGSTHLYADGTPQNLPAPIYGPNTGRDGAAARPTHAFISVEGGDIRYRLDGSDPVEPFGLLCKDGGVIDWTDPLQDYSAFISLMRVIAANGTDSALLNISWRT